MSRTAIPQFSLANPYYIGGTVTFYTVESGAATTTLATLYAGTTGSTQLNNPQQLDGEGKYSAAVYIEDSVIGVVTGPNVESHATGIINPSTGGGGGGGGTPGGFSGQLQYNNAAAFGGTTAGTYQGSGALFTFAAQAAGDTPLVLKGSAAQSASLQEWRNSAGTALSRITKDGYLGLVASGYINFDTTDGASGYGLRDNAGDIEFKDAGGAWTALNSLSGGGGGGGTLPSLANGSIWIGNGSAVATARTLSGDITVTNTGVTAIGSGKVTNAMLAGSIAASKLVGTDIATVGTLTAGATGAGFTIALGTSSVTGRVGASNLPQVSGRSVWANSGNGTADVASLQSSAGGQILNSTASSIAWTETPILGAAGSTVGSIGFQNATSGTIVVQPTTGALGSVTLTLPATTGTFALTGNKLSVFAATTSAELAGVITDETGSGALVFAASPAFTGTITAAAANFSGAVSTAGLTSAAHAITSTSANAFAVGPAGTTSPSLLVDASGSSPVTGLKILPRQSGSGLNLSVVGGGTDETLNIDAKGAGLVVIGSSSGQVGLAKAGKGVQVNSGQNTVGLYFGQSGTGLGYTSDGGAQTISVFCNTPEVMRWAQTNITAFSTLTAQSNFSSSVTRTIASAASPTWADIASVASTTTWSGLTNITSIIAKSQFEVPVLTASAAAIAITAATTVYIGGAPTTSSSGGFTPTITSAYALYVNSGLSFFGGGISQNTTNSGYGITTSHSPTVTSAATVAWNSLAISSTLTLTGTTTVSNDTSMVKFVQPLITDSSAVTVSKASTVYIEGEPVGGGSATVTAAGVFALKIASGNTSHAASSYINFGNTSGTGGYGIRDNAGTIEIKNSGGSWAAPGGSSGLTIGTTTITSGTTQRLLYDNAGAVGETTNIYSDGTFFSLGDSTQRAFGTTNATWQLNGTSSGAVQMGIGGYSSSSGFATVNNAGQFCFYRSKSGTVGSATVPAQDDILGSIRWIGAQQTGTVATQTEAARIMVVGDGTITSGASADMPGRMVFMTMPDGSGTIVERIRIDNLGNIIIGNVAGGAALATSATDGFLYLPTCAGAPTGNSTDYTGFLPFVYDSTNNKLMVNTSGTTWKGVTLA